MEQTFRAIGVSRLRIENDGDGVTTLVAGYGCPLRCRFCLNPQCFAKDFPWKEFTVEQLLDRVRIDDLYFQATGGGIVFGGGEPLLQAPFLHAFRQACPPAWKIGLESSLAVDSAALLQVIGDIDYYLIDIKDMNPAIYRSYTGREPTAVQQNLKLLRERIDPARVTLRIPLIPGYNTQEDRNASVETLRGLGYEHFDLFSYVIRSKEKKAVPKE